jgi:transcriptional regulator with XRE-family HTH domain
MNGVELKENRLKYGLTQEKLGELLGVSRNTIINYENGDVIPTTKSQILSTIFSNDKKEELKPISKDDELTSLIIDKLFKSDKFKGMLEDFIKEKLPAYDSEELQKTIIDLDKYIMEQSKKV